MATVTIVPLCMYVVINLHFEKCPDEQRYGSEAFKGFEPLQNIYKTSKKVEEAGTWKKGRAK
jgi:hypothetical protein